MFNNIKQEVNENPYDTYCDTFSKVLSEPRLLKEYIDESFKCRLDFTDYFSNSKFVTPEGFSKDIVLPVDLLAPKPVYTEPPVKETPKKVSPKKDFICDLCNKGFTCRSNMISHKKMHSREKPFTCTVCLKAFTQRYNLNRHERIHTGEKPYCCEVCKKTFSDASNSLKHRRTHTVQKS